MAQDVEKLPSGVTFPLTAGRISTSAVGRAACAAAAGAVDARLATQVSALSNWRKQYIVPMRRLTERAALSTESAVGISSAGLEYLHDTMLFASGDGAIPLKDLKPAESARLRTVSVAGKGERPRQLVVPYRGQRLAGDDLLAELDDWVADGAVEPGFAHAIAEVVRHPDWLDTSDVTMVVLGAGAEMGPAFSLLRWGGRVLGVDLARPEIWGPVIKHARESAGTLDVPVPVSAGDLGDDDAIANVAGANLIHETPDVLTLLSEVAGPMVLGNYLYADGGLHVRVSMAADALAVNLADRDDFMLAYLATPTDAFAVPWRDVEISRNRWRHRRTRMLQPPARLAGKFKRNYEHTVTSDTGHRVGIADCLVPQQGPNYALAKRLQRWRATIARQSGTRVSLNVAPATRTRSVIKNRMLAAAYAGAHRFGIRVAEPSTANTLMAAILVHDLRNPKAAANPETPLENPMDLFSVAADHGGLWTTGYEPRSVLGFAAAMGMFEDRA